MEITRLIYGQTTLPESWIYSGGDPSRHVPIDLAFFLIRTGQRFILVDVGCDSMEGFVLENFIGPVAALHAYGVTPEQITDIIITHAHQDHIGGIGHFPRARIYIQRQEYQRGKPHIPPDAAVTLFDDSLQLDDAIRIVKIGGHSIGSCVVEVGNTVLCGDECYTRYNLLYRVPTAKSCDPHRSAAFLQTYANGWNCLLCHDK